jgi:hypothetical protein
VLGVFLLGIALGALAGKRLCERNDERALCAVGALILSGAALIDLCAPWLLLLETVCRLVCKNVSCWKRAGGHGKG